VSGFEAQALVVAELHFHDINQAAVLAMHGVIFFKSVLHSRFKLTLSTDI